MEAVNKSSLFRSAVGVPKQEAVLQRRLVRALKRAQSEPFILCRELDSMHGIADVVVARINGKRLFNRHLSTRFLTRLNATTAKIVAQLRYRRWTDISAIRANTGLSHATIRTHLKHLDKVGAVLLRQSAVMLVRSSALPFPNIAAYEVKVADWKHALYQATHYRSFAHQVSVVLPTEIAERVNNKHRQRFQLFGIGLLGIDSASQLRWFLKPRRRKPTSHIMALTTCFQLMREPTFKSAIRS